MRELGEFIREQRRQAQLSLRKLSEQAGISNPYLSQIERGLRKPSAEILQAIAKALRISAETLYLRAGLLDSDSSGSDVVAAILKDDSITEGQKKTLIEVYHSLRIASSRPAEFRVGSGGSLGSGPVGGSETAEGAEVEDRRVGGTESGEDGEVAGSFPEGEREATG